MGASCSTDNRAGRPININAPSEVDEEKTLQKSLIAMSRLTVPFPVHSQPPSAEQALGNSSFETSNLVQIDEKPVSEVILSAADESSRKTENDYKEVLNEEVNLKKIVHDEVFTNNMPEIEPGEGNLICGNSIENIQKMNAENLGNRRRSIQVEEYRPEINEIDDNFVCDKNLNSVERAENEIMKAEERGPVMNIDKEALVDEGMNGEVMPSENVNIEDLYLPTIEAKAVESFTEFGEENEPEKVLELPPLIESVYETHVIENSVNEDLKNDIGANYVKEESPVIDVQCDQTQ